MGTPVEPESSLRIYYIWLVIQTLVQHFGLRRFDAYLNTCHGNHDDAAALYVWNVRMSGAAFEAIHVLEVVLRNAIDRELREWNQQYQGDRDWLKNPHPYLETILNEQRSLDVARERARKEIGRRREPLHDDVLAQLNFGSWRFLLPSEASVPKQKIWDEALANSFPHWYGDWRSLVESIHAIYKLRNRIAHLEPIFRTNLRARRRQILNVLKAIDPSMHAWYLSHDRLLPVIDARP